MEKYLDSVILQASSAAQLFSKSQDSLSKRVKLCVCVCSQDIVNCLPRITVLMPTVMSACTLMLHWENLFECDIDFFA